MHTEQQHGSNATCALKIQSWTSKLNLKLWKAGLKIKKGSTIQSLASVHNTEVVCRLAHLCRNAAQY